MADGFDGLGLSERALDAVHRLGWREPTPVQEEAIPYLLKGKDVIAEAQTGSGKTGAYGFPLVEDCLAGGEGLRALVLVPTRELAVQVATDLNAYADGAPFLAVPVYGGVPFDGQLAALRDPRAAAAVATPGRLLDFLRARHVSLAGVRFVVIDEADRLFDLGFLSDVERILADLPGIRQVAMFSATFPDPVVRLAWRHTARPKEVRIDARPRVPSTAAHFRVRVPSSKKREALVALLAAEQPESCIVFTRKRDGARDLVKYLVSADVKATALHGDLQQDKREAALRRFREGVVRVLVATDVAARGLDVPDVSHVVNYDIAEEADAYIHRAGRTARAGKPGRVFTIETEQDHLALVRQLAKIARPKDYRLEGFEPPAERTDQLPTTGPPKRRPDKKRLKPGWEKRKGRR